MTFGFIGTGNMGGALATAAAKNAEVLLYDRDSRKASTLAENLGCKAGTLNNAAACDFVVLGVKPQMMGELFEELAPLLKKRTDRFVLLSMAAGVSMAQIRSYAGQDYPIIRIMPNIPVSVGAGMILYDQIDVTQEELSAFIQTFSEAGRLKALPEKLIDAGAAVSGCGPAFAAMFAEALADGGVACGLPRKDAAVLAAQTLFGSAKLLLEMQWHPGELKDAVCSPGGTTIAGVQALENDGLRAACMDAVVAAYKKTAKLA